MLSVRIVMDILVIVATALTRSLGEGEHHCTPVGHGHTRSHLTVRMSDSGAMPLLDSI